MKNTLPKFNDWFLMLEQGPFKLNIQVLPVLKYKVSTLVNGVVKEHLFNDANEATKKYKQLVNQTY